MLPLRIVDGAGKVLVASTKLLDALEEIRKQLGFNDPEEAFKTLVAFLNDTGTLSAADTRKVSAIVAAIGSKEELLIRLQALLAGFGIALPPKAQPLLKTLADLAKEVNDKPYPLFKADAAVKESPGDVSFSLAAGGQAELELQTYGAAHSTEVGFAIPAGHAAQRYGLNGGLTISGSLRAPFSGGSAQLGVAASASSTLDLFYQFPESTHLITALLNSARGFAAPWSLPDMMSALQPVGADGSCLGFRRIHMTAEGRFELSGTLTVGKSWKYSTAVTAADHSAVVGLEASIGASLSARVRHEGKFDIAVEKDATDRPVISLKHSSAGTNQGAVSVSAGIEITGLDKVAVPLVKDLLPGPEPWLAELEQWANVGDKLFARLSAELPSDKLAKAVGELLLGENAPQAGTLLADRIASEVRQLANERVETWLRSAEDAGTELLTRALDRVGLAGEIRDAVVARYLPVLTGELGSIETALTRFLTDKVKQGRDKLDQLLEPLNTVGENLQELRTKVNASANAIVEPVKRFLSEYQKLRNRVIGALEKTAQIKIGVELGYSWSKVETDTALLTFRILSANPRTRLIYRALMTGRLESAWPEFEAARLAGEIDSVGGRFTAQINSRRELSLSINLGELQLSRKRVMLSQVQVEVDPSGTVLMAKSAFSQTSVTESFKERRDVNIMGGFELAAARDSRLITQPLAFSMAFADERGMKPEELEEFLGSLERPDLPRRLLASGATRRAVDKYKQLFNESLHASRIDVALRVDADAMKRLVQINDTDIFDLACNYQVRLLFQHAGNRDDFIEGARAYPPTGGSVIAFIREIGGMRSDDSARDKYNIAVFGQTVSAKTGDATLRLVRKAQSIKQRADHLIRAISGIRQIDGIVAQVDASGLSPGGKSSEIARRATRINDDINDSLREWIYARGPISGLFTESVPRLTVAFLGMLAELVGLQDPLLMPIVSVDRGRKHTVENRDLSKETWVVI